MQLQNTRDTLLTFDTSDPPATQFSLSKKMIGYLDRTHGITNSESELMMM